MAMMFLEVAVVLALLTCCSSSSYAVGSSTDDDGPFVGVDFGTYESCVGVYKDGEVQIIPSFNGKITTPSSISYSNSGHLIVEQARSSAHIGTTIFGVKRFLGLNISEAQGDYPFLTHLIKVDYQVNKTVIGLRGRDEKVFIDFHPEYLASKILSSMRSDVITILGFAELTRAVISVPGVYGYTQRQAIVDAAHIAGFKSVKLISDPTSIALAYGINRIEGKMLLVVDFGGSSLDVGIITVENGNVHVLGGGGSFSLGGQNFNMQLMIVIYNHVMKERNLNPFHDIESILKAWNECEAVKIVLTQQEFTKIKLRLKDQDKVKYKISIRISRSKLEFLMEKEFNLIESIIVQTIEKAGVDNKEIDMVIMAGGSSQVPKFRQLLRGMYEWKKVVYLQKDKSVAYGAAVYGGMLSRNTTGLQIYDTTQWKVGVEVTQPVLKPIIEENDIVPATKSVTVHTSEAKLVVYERFSNAQGEYTHRLGSIPVPQETRGSAGVDVTIGVDSEGLLQMLQKDWTAEAQERLLQRDLLKRLVKESSDPYHKWRQDLISDTQGKFSEEVLHHLKTGVPKKVPVRDVAYDDEL